MVNKAKFILLCILFAKLDCHTSEINYLQVCNNFVNICMNTWTKIDLIQAIHTTKNQQKEILEELFDMTNQIYQESKKIRTFLYLLNSYELASIQSLVKAVDLSFQEVFSDSESQTYTKIIEFLKNTNLFLETPNNIESIITADHICVKSSFS